MRANPLGRRLFSKKTTPALPPPIELTPTFSSAGAGSLIYDGYGTDKMRDGISDDETSVWASNAGDWSLIADLGAPTLVREIWLMPSHVGSWGPANLDGLLLEYGDAITTPGTPEVLTSFATVSGTAWDTYTKYFPNITARYWQIRTGGFGSAAEFRIFG